MWRRAAGVGTCRSLPQEFWTFAAGVASKEVWSSSVLLLLEFLAFVPQGSLLTGGLRHRGAGSAGRLHRKSFHPLRCQHFV